ncbi:MAG TPA: AmmeMemoRadiSam system radical SAM enzyme [Chloroflexi bacterium]|jgi:pyruvate formate lyase activating enzyme|nr:AmmeMemoRadiSam system radical SAM enzyme [Chloroflexota bacterium]
MREALLYERLDGAQVRCHLCMQGCRIANGQLGLCQVRRNDGGTLYTLVYGRPIAQAIDPIEKKPLFHVYPGSQAYSIATPGCNLRCTFCQNADISQAPQQGAIIPETDVPPEAVVRDAQRYGCRSIAYTYTEPTIFFEYAYAIATLAAAAGMANIYVTNGYMTADMLAMVTPPTGPQLLDAANVDLKAFRDAFYRRECGARLQPVLDNLVSMKQRGVWIEVTTLIIPGRNDSDEELRDIARFIASELGTATPWHVSRFHPTYRLTDAPPTPVAAVRRAREIGLEEGLFYVYEGNVPLGDGENTLCPTCGRTVIERRGFRVVRNDARSGACPHCGGTVHGIGL